MIQCTARGLHHLWCRCYQNTRVLAVVKTVGLLALFVAASFAFLPPPDAQAQSSGSRVLTLELSKSAKYRMKTEEATQEILIQVSGNRRAIRGQVSRWSHPLLQQALVIPKSSGDSIIRLKLRRKSTVYAGIAPNPYRLILGLGAPIPLLKGVTSRSVVDFHMGKASREYAENNKPRPPDIQSQIRKLLSDPEVRPAPTQTHGTVLAVGSHVLYPITLPKPPQAFPLWEPKFRAPGYLNKKKHAHILQYYKDARDGYLKETADAIHLELVANPDGALSADLRYLEASILYMLGKVDDPSIPTMTPVQRARLAYNKHPRHPMAAQTKYLTALGYSHLGFYHEASYLLRSLLDEIDSDHPHARSIFIAKAMADHSRGKPLLASKYYLEALELTPANERENIILVMAAAQLEAGRGQAGAKLVRFLQRKRSKHLKTKYYRYLLAESLYREDRFTEAAKVFRKLLDEEEESPHAAFLQIRLGECLLMAESLKEAISFFTVPLITSTLSGPDREYVAGIWKLRQMQLGMLRSPVEGHRPFIARLADLKIQFPISPLEPEIIFETANYYHDLGDHEASLMRFRELLVHYPDYPYRREAVNLVWDGFQSRLKDLHNRGDTFRLLSLYEQFLPVLDSESLHDQRLFLLVAHSYRSLGLYDKAYHALSQTFFIHDQNPDLRDESLLLLAALHRLEQHYDEHDDVLTYLRKRSKNRYFLGLAKLEEGLVSQDVGKSAQALKQYSAFVKMLDNEPETALGWQYIGELHKDSRAYAKAEFAYQNGIKVLDELLAKHSEASKEEEHGEGAKSKQGTSSKKKKSYGSATHDSKALMQSEEKELDEALLGLLRVKQTEKAMKSQKAELTYLLAESLQQQEKWSEAAKAFAVALEMEAKHPSAQYALYSRAEALSKSGDLSEATKIWKALTEVENASDSVWSSMAAHKLSHAKWEEQNL